MQDQVAEYFIQLVSLIVYTASTVTLSVTFHFIVVVLASSSQNKRCTSYQNWDMTLKPERNHTNTRFALLTVLHM